jgi:hypothetical protein
MCKIANYCALRDPAHQQKFGSGSALGQKLTSQNKERTPPIANIFTAGGN